jgi:hypothetical protein
MRLEQDHNDTGMGILRSDKDLIANYCPECQTRLDAVFGFAKGCPTSPCRFLACLMIYV